MDHDLETGLSTSRVGLLHGHEMPRLGLGTWPLVDEECQAVVEKSVGLGYRLIDTAEQYSNEVAVGKGIAAVGLPRGELFITSKFNKEWHSKSGVREAYERSLSALKLDYLDLFVCHWPVPALGRYIAAWEGLIDLFESGLVKAVGVSNFKPSHIARIVEATGVTPDVNQIQLSPDIARVEARRAHQRYGIVTQAWSPIGRQSNLREHPLVGALAKELNRTPAQILLRWHVQQGIIPIPNAAREDWLRENIAVFDFNLSDSAMQELARLDRGEGAARDSDDPSQGH